MKSSSLFNNLLSKMSSKYIENKENIKPSELSKMGKQYGFNETFPSWSEINGSGSSKPSGSSKTSGSSKPSGSSKTSGSSKIDSDATGYVSESPRLGHKSLR
jgi:hypothetical protein